MAAKAVRDAKLWSPVIRWETRPSGEILVWREDPLGPYPDKLNERLVSWAEMVPDRVWMADREGTGAWQTITYGAALDQVRRIGQFLLDLGLSADRPLVILSENSIPHALLAFGAQHVGIPSAAIAPAYALNPSGLAKLQDIAGQITPGMVFAENAGAFREAVDAAFGSDIALAGVRNMPAGRGDTFSFDDILKTEPTSLVDRAFDQVGPDTVAKFLFTSGTTGSPKAVIQTQRMLCSNQEMVADCYQYFREEPPILVDWAPWNHTASGNKCFNIAIYNGGTYYIDRGKPTPGLMGQTIANLREISPTWYFNVPAGFEMLVQAMGEDEGLRANFFKDLKMLMYAGAGMAQHTWDALLGFSEQATGQRVPLCTGIGSTETAPFALFCTEPQDRPGNVGIPAQGVTMKLVPFDDRYELRLKGPNVTPGYWRNEKLTAEAFDEEGFYRIGDAVKFAEPGDPRKGFYFDGRTAENFKLQTGTWVSVGVLRAQLVNQFGGLVRDAVITGENRNELGALLVPFMPALRALVTGEGEMADEEILAHPSVRAAISERLAEHQRQATGSATRIMRVMLMHEPLRFEKGEVTDKGSINQRAVLAHRADLVDVLHGDGPGVIRMKKELAA
ncbi:feruloyl-CoA synthase [Pseudorhizobium endolithicum]|uniref:Feruloyl-CoA synthase n=1 Tax=Pseudorhizobium endolithicum TaxID=1191678 RepID=A0ABN7JVA5_9HYPH|nr:feruloyl-CoA synthase [Pseudorhizobium endolithicum]CAD7050012.1 feruloyl-CoA synthase [Pseudorhizobium endolithicum]